MIWIPRLTAKSNRACCVSNEVDFRKSKPKKKRSAKPKSTTRRKGKKPPANEDPKHKEAREASKFLNFARVDFNALILLRTKEQEECIPVLPDGPSQEP